MSWSMRVGYVLVKLFWLQVTETDLSQLKVGGGNSISMQTFLVPNHKARLAEEGRRPGTGRLSILPSLTSASLCPCSLSSLLDHLLSWFLALHTVGKVASHYCLVYVLNLSPL